MGPGYMYYPHGFPVRRQAFMEYQEGHEPALMQWGDIIHYPVSSQVIRTILWF
jgi:hypothetical protein